MKHKMVTFQLHTIGVWMLVIGGLIFSVLIFAAGYLIGTSRRGKATVALPMEGQAPSPVRAPAGASADAPGQAGAPVPPQVAAKPTASETFTLRVAAFATEEEAKKSVEDLAMRKLQASVVAMPTSSATILYTVCIGNYASRAEANAAAEALAKNHAIEGIVVPAT